MKHSFVGLVLLSQQSGTAKHYPEVSAPAGPNTSVLETSDSAAKVAKLKWAVGK